MHSLPADPPRAHAAPRDEVIVDVADIAPGARCWRLTGASDLAGRCWGGAWVWHHGPSNDTHCLSPAAGRMLHALQQQGALDEHALRQRCDVAAAELAGALAALETLGWVQRC